MNQDNPAQAQKVVLQTKTINQPSASKSKLIILLIALLALLCIAVSCVAIFIRLFIRTHLINDYVPNNTIIPTATSTPDSLNIAPSGFDWYYCKNMQSYFLKPDNWYALEESSSSRSFACFISREKISNPEDIFKTGLSVNFIQGILANSGKTASQFAKDYISVIDSNYTTLSASGSYQGYTTNDVILSDTLTARYLAFASDELDQVYIIWFESPESEWRDAFDNYGKAILQNLGLRAE